MAHVAAAAKAGMKRRRAPSNDAGPALFDDAAPKHVSLRNRIRSLKRLLAKGNIPVQALKDKARLLRKMEQQLLDDEFSAKERAMGAKYHGVKFIERQKVERALTQAEKALTAAAAGAESTDDVATLQARVRKLQEQLLYIKWYPRHLKYHALYAKGGEESDPKLEGKRAFALRWALANAAAGDFLRTPPGQDAPLDVDAIVADRLPRLRVKKRKTKGAGEEEDAAARAAGEGGEDEDDEELGSEDEADASDDSDKGDVQQAAAPVKRARKAAPAPAAGSKGRAAAASHTAADDDRISEGSDAEGLDVGDAAADLAADAFFSAGAPEELPTFHEEQANADDESGGYEVMGPQSTRARWEREHLNEKRYRDSADRRGHAAGWGATRDGHAAPPPVAAAPDPEPEPDFSHLSERKRRRAERAVKYARERDEKAGGALLPGAGRFKEAFYGTDLDAGARLKSEDKLRRAAAKAAPHQQAARPDRRFTGSKPPAARPSFAARPPHAAAAPPIVQAKPAVNKAPGSHLKFVD